MGKIKLYPSNWLYNAGVVGLLNLLPEEKIEKLLSNDGSICLDIDMLSSLFKVETGKYGLNEWAVKYLLVSSNETDFTEDVFKICVNKYFGQKSLYSNLVSPRPKKKKSFSNYTESEKKTFKSSVQSLNNKLSWLTFKEDSKIAVETICSFCNEFFKCKKSDLKKFLFLNKFCADLGGSKEFPNIFWNNTANQVICPRCSFFIMHHHLSFISTQNGQIFINAPSFKVMWYLNKYASEIFNKRTSYQLREILGMSFIEFSQRVSITLGAWSMMNIEMVVKRYNNATKQTEIDYYSLPYEITKLLLNREITSLISQTGEDCILQIILEGQFDKLLTLNQKILRYAITNSSAFDDKYLATIRNKDAQSLKNLSMILPELYVKINSILKER